MTDRKQIVRRWLDVGGLGPAEAWHELCSKDLVVRFPYAPPPVKRELHGLDEALAVCSAHWKNMAKFEWHDVEIHATDDPDLYMSTARSETETVGGVPYCNNYVLMTRFRDGKIVEHVEWFDPMLVIEMMKTLA
jgi:ketosteroid isomerase-like protein